MATRLASFCRSLRRKLGSGAASMPGRLAGLGFSPGAQGVARIVRAATGNSRGAAAFNKCRQCEALGPLQPRLIRPVFGVWSLDCHTAGNAVR